MFVALCIVKILTTHCNLKVMESILFLSFNSVVSWLLFSFLLMRWFKLARRPRTTFNNLWYGDWKMADLYIQDVLWQRSFEITQLILPKHEGGVKTIIKVLQMYSICYSNIIFTRSISTGLVMAKILPCLTTTGILV